MTLAVPLMTRNEAQVCVRAVKRNLDQARDQLLVLYEREGWRALGYRNWRECAEEEFGYKQSRVYQLLAAARIQRDISTNVEMSPATPAIPEAQLRQLAALKTPVERRAVWTEVVATTEPDGAVVTARHVRAVVTQRAPVQLKPGAIVQVVERRGEPACIACAAFTDPNNWFITDKGAWQWVGSDAPPHLRAIPSVTQREEG